MKKWLTIIFTSLLIFSLAACNTTTEDSQSGNESNSLSLLDVYKKTLDRQSEIKSMTSDMKMNMKMLFNFEGESKEVTSITDLKMDMILDKAAIYMEGKMSTSGATEVQNFEMDIKSYIVGDVMYLYNSETGVWMKLPVTDAEMQNLIGKNTNQINSLDQLKALEPFINDFKVKEENNEYILTLETASEKLTEYLLKDMDLSIALGITEEEKEVLEKIKYEKIDYVIKINKDTFDLTAMDIVLKMTIEEDGDPMTIELDSKMVFSNFNGINEIKVPQEVVNNSLDLDSLEFELE